jgi:hypothetical protein
MAARAAVALSLAVLAWAQCARAADNPSCAQYREPMAYNACLARHGPKANNLVGLSGHARPGAAAPSRSWTGGTPATFHRWRRAQPAHGRMQMEFQVR